MSLGTELLLACVLSNITPSQNLNPKAADYWGHGSQLSGVSVNIDTAGIRLVGPMVDKLWETYSGKVTDWWVTIEFNGPYEEDGPYHRVVLSTLTMSGYFYRNYKRKDDSDPTFWISCTDAGVTT